LRATGPVAFEHHLIDLAALQFAGAAHDGFFDVIGGHAGAFGCQDRRTQAGIGVRVAAVARGDHDFFDDARETFSALGVQGGFFMLDGRPFRMA
jgi:hypothetical protein